MKNPSGANPKVRVGIIGSAGYTGGELLRLLIFHPEAAIVFAHSESNAGKPIHHVHTDLLGDTDLVFASSIDPDIDVLFLCVGHGNAQQFLNNHTIDSSTKIIDLSQDFRLKERAHFQNRTFVYGLPEFQREAIQSANAIANPGCFATTIELALLPLAQSGLLAKDIHVNATTGSTGAGQSPSATTHFSWRNNNLSVYKTFTHQHLLEIKETLSMATGLSPDIHFIPQRGAFSRGILASAYLTCPLSEQEAHDLYQAYYAPHPFTHVSESNVDLKQIVNTNKCLVHLEKHGDKLLITSIADNLLKGASGQAVQNMNLLFGLEETSGLKLKAIGF